MFREQPNLSRDLTGFRHVIRLLGGESGIGASLRGKHGYDAAELIQYGFNPRRPNRTLEKSTNRADPAVDYPGGSTSE